MIRSWVLGLAFGAVFLGLALWGVPLDALGRAFADMQWIYLLHVSLALAVQYLLRAWRQLLMIRALAPRAGFRDQLAIVVIGFFCVNAFPARIGEAVRPLLFYERFGVPLGAGFGLVFLERIIDLAALFATLLVVLFLVPVPDHRIELVGRSFSLLELVRTASLAVLLPALAVLAGLAALGPAALRLGERIARVLEARATAPALIRFARFALRFTESFVEGVRILRRPGRLAGVLALTAAMFLSMGLPAVFLAHAFGLGERVGLGAGMGILAITMLGIALPAPPGFAGVFEASVRAGLALFGVSGEDVAGRALAFALVFHWWPFLLMGAGAGFFLWRDGVGLGHLFRFARGSGSGPVEPRAR